MKAQYIYLAGSIFFVAACTTRDTIATFRSGVCQDDIVFENSNVCSGQLAKKTFQHAMCACGDLTFGGSLHTNSFDSQLSPQSLVNEGAHVGVNGKLHLNGMVYVEGNLVVSGGGIEEIKHLHVEKNLYLGGNLNIPLAQVEIGQDAQIGGNINVSSLTVTGSLTTPNEIDRNNVWANKYISSPVEVPTPCKCESTELIDVATVIENHRLINDNSAIGLSENALSNIRGDLTLELPCGKFFLSSIQSNQGRVTLRAIERTALFIAGNITLGGAFAVEIAPGAELDLFIGGNVNLMELVRIGNPERPQALRLYIGSSGSINWPEKSILAGNLYAPKTDLVLNGSSFEIFGAMVVNHVLTNSDLTIHYDRAIISGGENCPR
jgi:hypothetical protein